MSALNCGVIYQGNCLDLMENIASKSIDMIICDLPYGTTKNKWDVIIPFVELWRNYERIIKDNGCIALFCDGMFMADLMNSNKKLWKYNIVWDKCIPSGFLNANKMPLRRHEEIAIFYKKQPQYNPQKVQGLKNHSKGVKKENKNNNYGEYKFADNKDDLGDMKHPTSIIKYEKPHPSVSLHPTQKPISLIENLILTYTNEGEVILDNCAGSGSTIIACINTNRKYIGIELMQEYVDIANNRIMRETSQTRFII